MVLLAIGLAAYPVRSRSKRQHPSEIDGSHAGELFRLSKREKVSV
jgi:hypothetical protein